MSMKKIAIACDHGGFELKQPVINYLVENGYEYEDMFRWLKTGLAGLSIEECDVLENYVLKWQIYGAMWTREEDWDENPDGYGAPLGTRQQGALNEVNRLRKRVSDPLRKLAEELKCSENAAGKVEALYGFMERIALQDSLEQQMQEQAKCNHAQAMEEINAKINKLEERA